MTLFGEGTSMREHWKTIPGFSSYEVNQFGEIYRRDRDLLMKFSHTLAGHVKVSLICDYDGARYTKGVAQIVAEAFVMRPTPLCTQVVMLDGNLDNIAAENLIWRPPSFAWLYVHQLKTLQPVHYKNLKIRNVDTGVVYNSVIEAGMTEGLLFDDIWRSTYSGARIFPFGMEYEVVT
jgi:hypothetical protein